MHESYESGFFSVIKKKIHLRIQFNELYSHQVNPPKR